MHYEAKGLSLRNVLVFMSILHGTNKGRYIKVEVVPHGEENEFDIKLTPMGETPDKLTEISGILRESMETGYLSNAKDWMMFECFHD